MDTTTITLNILQALQAMSLFELIGALAGVIGVWLAARQSVWTWPLGLVSVAMYVVVFYDARLYADMGLNAFYVVTSLYGWYVWLYGGKGHTERKVGRVGKLELLVLIILGTAFTLGLGYFLENYTDADLPYTDSATTAISLIGYWMMAKKRLENWIVWLVVDTVYVGVYTYKELYITSVLYFIFLILCVIGYRDWKKSLEEDKKAQLVA
ncbi:nicotinamide mononucleotide transporter [Pontibacter aydingkolensis]|uniref:Nicotinamide riboside transporter PnuC n=1 Tax=Pontibacter aydingkolensis TaxID=1911536 RepID=A0ABS7CQ49_9BACT|nr:nicotinamide riboside transporter PnuC [Pontibacter aydingkolensis]MBW7465657.1 nicotinamide riboside transporter PnuC [Pontibacter aydingkolensis]